MKYKEYNVSVGSTALCIELSHHHVVWCTFIAYVNKSNWKTINRIQIHDLHKESFRDLEKLESLSP